MACYQEERGEYKYGGACPTEYGANTNYSKTQNYGATGGACDYGTAGYSKPSACDYGSAGGYGASAGGYGASAGGYSTNSSLTHQSSGSYGSSGGYGTSGGAAAGYGATGYGASTGGYGSGGHGSAQMMKPGHMMCAPEVFSDPFCALAPSSFPPGTDQKIVECFNRIDKDNSGFICDRELQGALSTFNMRFSMRTVHLLMYMFTNSNNKRIGPKEFLPLMSALQHWKTIFQRFDRNRNGSIDVCELREALCSLGFPVSPMILNLLVSKFDKRGVKCSIEYDNFIECCLTVKGLTERFKAKENCGSATFTYEEFLNSVLPFVVA